MFAKKGNSRAALINKALIKGGKNIVDIVNAVMNDKPNDDPKKVKGQISAILRDIRNSKGYWKQYNIVVSEQELRIEPKEPATQESVKELTEHKEPEIVIQPTEFEEVTEEPVSVPDVPDVNPSLPVADITGLKHNRFAVIKAIREALVQNGWTNEKLDEAGKDLIKNGKDLATILETAGKYVTVVEEGMPVIMTSGIPA